MERFPMTIRLRRSLLFYVIACTRNDPLRCNNIIGWPKPDWLKHCCGSMKRLMPLLLSFALTLNAAEPDYPVGPDSKPQEGVPKGEVVKGTFDSSKIFPGTTRDYSVYVPKQYDGAKSACLMIFQDGLQYNAPVVFDNLIHRKEIPVIVGVFVMHGRVRSPSTNALDRFNRSYEYDSVNDNYARFLLEEMLPHVAKEHGLNLSTNGNDRAIAGNSSGAICAFTAAWERPDAFSRVFSAIGTYVGLRGGNEYPTLIRKTEPKAIRVFLQDGSNDLNIYGGNWWIANQDMLSALDFAGYEVRHVWGEGGHNSRHATAIFPDALRWLWQGWPAPVKKPWKTSEQPVSSTNRVLIPPVMTLLERGEEWQLVSEGHRFTEGPTANAQGELFFTDIPNNRIHKVGIDGTVTVFAEDTGGANGLKFGPDGKLYACANGRKEIAAYGMDGSKSGVAKDVNSNDLIVNERGDIYWTDPGNRKVWFMAKGGEPRVADEGIERPNGICLSPDQSLLFVADTRNQFVYSFQVQPDGTLAHKQKYFYLHLVDGSTQSGADGITVDSNGNLYVTSEIGLQICDQAGRVNSIIPKPHRAWLSNVAFGGKNLDELYVTCGDRVFKRKTRATGVLAFRPPSRPTPPRL
jgi:sugar lactone lactonase YvrE/enterochelin esterase-like enzyme